MDSLDSPRLLRKEEQPISNNTLEYQASMDTNMVSQENIAAYTSLQNTFKVSNMVRPRYYTSSQRTLNLQQPKHTKSTKAQNVFDRADFRGLLHADFKATIKGAFAKPGAANNITVTPIYKKGQGNLHQSPSSQGDQTAQAQASATQQEAFRETGNSGNLYNSQGKASMKANGDLQSQQLATTTNSYGRRKQTLEQPASAYGTGHSFVKRPMTAYFSKSGEGAANYGTTRSDSLSTSF